MLQRARHHVGVALVGPHELRHAEAAQRAGRRHVGVERVGIDLDVVDVVGAGRGEARLLRHARADVGIGAAVPEHLAFARDDLAVLVDAALDAERRGMPRDLVEHLLEGVGDLHGLARDHGERERQRLELDVELGAVARAEIRHLDAHLVLRPAEQAGDLGADERRPLRGVVERDVGVLVVGDAGERLERQVQHLLRLELVLELVRGGGIGLVEVAAAQPVVEREVGVLGVLQMLEVGEGAGGLELVVDIDLRGQRIDLVIDRRQFLVFGGDELHRLLGDVRIGGDHGGDRLADEAHLLVRQDRLVVERRAVIGTGQHLHHVVDGDDVEHARQLLRGAGVDRLDLAVGHRAAEQLGMQHARHPHGVGVFGAAGDLVAAFEARHRAADLRADLGAVRIEGRDHQCVPPSRASRMARRT